MGLIGDIFSGVNSANAAQNAANAQQTAAQQAQALQAKNQQASLGFQQNVLNTTQANEAPYIQAGQQAETQLSGLLSTPGQGLLSQFQAPTAVTEQNDPGYEFRLQQGNAALQNSAAASGGLLSGNTAKAIADYSQNYASNEYSNVYNRAFNEFQTNQNNTFNRLSSLASGGQTAIGQQGQLGQQAAANVANVNTIAGAQQGQNILNAGTARASGYIGQSNAYNQMFSNINSQMQLAMLAAGA